MHLVREKILHDKGSENDSLEQARGLGEAFLSAVMPGFAWLVAMCVCECVCVSE
jgi:hypothetical protein